MKILVDEMPIFPDDDCWFSDQAWDSEENVWKTYCVLGPDGVTDCDLENGECSKLQCFNRFRMRTSTRGDIYEPLQYRK